MSLCLVPPPYRLPACFECVSAVLLSESPPLPAEYGNHPHNHAVSTLRRRGYVPARFGACPQEKRQNKGMLSRARLFLARKGRKSKGGNFSSAGSSPFGCTGFSASLADGTHHQFSVNGMFLLLIGRLPRKAARAAFGRKAPILPVPPSLPRSRLILGQDIFSMRPSRRIRVLYFLCRQALSCIPSAL